MSPRKTNDDFGNNELSELKKAIKNKLIKNYEYIADKRQYDGRIIQIGIGLLLVSVVIFIGIATL